MNIYITKMYGTMKIKRSNIKMCCEFNSMVRETTRVDYIFKTCQYVWKIVDTKYKLLCNTHVLIGNGKMSLNTSEQWNVPADGLSRGRNVMCVF
jgi:hypothetical protein